MNKELLERLEVTFAGLNRQSAADSFPPPGTLKTFLAKQIDPSGINNVVAATPQTVNLFATAAVEMWLRSVHSFLISASLTKASPVWASVAGYYSSHYSVRAFAHLFGVFQLHRKGQIVRLDTKARQLTYVKKGAKDGEHKFYWNEVSNLANDPFFYPNLEDQSDGGHRNKINYWDHIGRFPAFEPLNVQELKDRVARISTMAFSSVPKPRPDGDHFPDIENVQIIAYHRLVKFRQLLDDACSANRFWMRQRKPTWCPSSIMNFSVVEAVFLETYAEAS